MGEIAASTIHILCRWPPHRCIVCFRSLTRTCIGVLVSTASFMNSLKAKFVDHDKHDLSFSTAIWVISSQAVAEGTVPQSPIFGGAIRIAVSTIVMNNHLQAALEGVVSPPVLKSLFIFPFTISEYDLKTEALFRKGYIKAFSEDLRVPMYVATIAFSVSLCVGPKHPPTAKERSELLAKAA